MSNDGNIFNAEKKKYEFIHGFSKDYGNSPGRIRWMSEDTEYMRMFHGAMEQAESVLEIGFGKGSNIDYLRGKYPGVRLQGIDISSVAVSSRPDLEVYECSAHDLRIFNDKAVDLTIHFDGLEHIPEPWQLAAIGESLRVTRGLVFHSIHTKTCAEDKIMRKHGLGELHVNLKSHDDWLKVFAKHGGSEIVYAEERDFKSNFVLKPTL